MAWWPQRAQMTSHIPPKASHLWAYWFHELVVCMLGKTDRYEMPKPFPVCGLVSEALGILTNVISCSSLDTPIPRG